MNHALRAVQLTKRYGRFNALDSLDLEVRPGRCSGSSARTGEQSEP
jgi:ABC-type multidrug transport system ATPase subunit